MVPVLQYVYSADQTFEMNSASYLQLQRQNERERGWQSLKGMWEQRKEQGCNHDLVLVTEFLHWES